MARKMKKGARKKVIYAYNMSHPNRTEYKFTKTVEASKFLNISIYKIRSVAESVSGEAYIRNEDKILYKIVVKPDFVVHARPEFMEWEEIDFTSAYKCCSFFGISKDTYYRRASRSIVGEENPAPVVDRGGNKWFLTFLTPLEGEFNGFKKGDKHDSR